MYAYYPGFFNEFDAQPGATYRVGCWVKTDGCDFELTTSAVREMGGDYCKSNSVSTKEVIGQWKRVTLEQTVCPDMKFLRIEVSVKSPGIIQLDGMTMEKIKD
jgi:hypothetical protein